MLNNVIRRCIVGVLVIALLFCMVVISQMTSLLNNVKGIRSSHITSLINQGVIDRDTYLLFSDLCLNNNSSSISVISIKPPLLSVSNDSDSDECKDFKLANELFLQAINNADYSSIKIPFPLKYFF